MKSPASAAFLNGVPELLILEALRAREMYGYELVQAIRSMSGEEIAFAEGVIYPVLHLLERDGALTATKATGRVISLEIEEVEVVDGQIVPKRLRERIRAAGPTAPLTLHGQAYDRQHLGEDGHVSI